jgi:hypothetical protein
MQEICEICCSSHALPRQSHSSAAVSVCAACARQLWLAAAADGGYPAAGFCRCGAYIAGLAEFIRHVARCSEHWR